MEPVIRRSAWTRRALAGRVRGACDRVRRAYDRARGVPIETELGPYRAVVRAARAIPVGALSDADILARARELRDEAGKEAETLEARETRAGARAGLAPGSAVPDGASAERERLGLALAAEAARRALGLEPFEEQLVAAAAMARGRVAQMGTGEGKTLSAALAASCLALDGSGFHVLTANDYLAGRDARWMRPLYEALGLSVASVTERSSREERRAAYRADVSYLSARELGFDYLRDSLARDRSELVQRPFSRAIVDEADFILIDEARVPLVIAGAAEGDGVDVRAIDRIAASLSEGRDYRVDAELRSVAMTAAGHARAAELLGAPGEDLPDGAKARLFAALHARRLLRRDVDYIVRDGATRLVDSFTGRVAERRQWPWGIQAALEAKEGLEVGAEGCIYGSITAQGLLGLYPFLAAMTATAESAAEEFWRVYGMGTVVVPPSRPSIRVDLPDAVFWSRPAKNAAIVAEVAKECVTGRPVLVGTSSVAESEELAAELAAAGIGCVTLNARNDEAEASLIARAGDLGAVTVSTDMAGRGTDIKLGSPRVRELGGLYVIGSCRHESRRMDDQLRGRAGRQGDPGTTRLFVSLEDGLFERYGVRDFLPEPYRSSAPSGPEAGKEIGDPACAREIRRAQAIIEGQNSAIRRLLIRRSLIVEYDRRYVRALRDAALERGALPESLESSLEDLAAGLGGRARLGPARPALAEAFVARLDEAWADHLALVEDVKEGLALQAHGGKDPSREYLSIVSDEFERAMRDLEAAVVADGRELLGASPGAPKGGAAGPKGGPPGRGPSPGATDLAGPRRLPVPFGAARLRPPSRPSSTWTYAVEDERLPGFDLGAIPDAAAAALGPLAILLFVAERAGNAFSRLRAGRRASRARPRPGGPG